MQNLKFAFFMLLLFVATALRAQIIVNNNIPVEQLVIDEITGAGISASFISCSGDSVSNIGTFSGSSNIGFGDGVIMATGNISVCIGPNDQSSASLGGGTAGDVDLDSLFGADTYDAFVIEFDFVPATDSIELTFVFGSEEYPEYVCSDFNDIFAFLLSGPNPDSIAPYDKTNIAKIPGTSLPVAINSVNPGVPGQNYTNNGCLTLSYSSLYVDNTTGSTIQYDGFTVPLTIYANVFADSLYHIKFAIADDYDGSYDSGVFLKKNSFKCVGYVNTSTETKTNKYFRIAPNPADCDFTIILDNTILTLCILSANGQIMQSYSDSVPDRINVNNLPNGYYFIRISTSNGTTTSPLIISH